MPHSRKLTKFSKEKAIFWTLVSLFALVCLSVFSNEVLHKDKWVETNAIIVTKDYRDRPRSQGDLIYDRKTYYIAYIYAFDTDKALSYKSQQSLDRGLRTQEKFQNYKASDYAEYSGEIDLSSMVLDTNRVDFSTYKLLSVGQNITVEYREDMPWESKIKNWNNHSPENPNPE